MDRNIQVSRPRSSSGRGPGGRDRRAEGYRTPGFDLRRYRGVGVAGALAALLDRVGKVLHYNTDETQLVAGRAAPLRTAAARSSSRSTCSSSSGAPRRSTKASSSRSTRPRSRPPATTSEAIPELEYGTDVIIDVKLGEGSGDLQDVFGEETQQVPMANDTSFGVGHAPLTETETIVYEAEHELNTTYHADHPELGPDVKIMGKREGDRIDITVAAAMVDRYVDGLDEYDDAVENVREFVTELAESRTDRRGPRRRQHRRRLRRGLRLPHRHRHLRGAGRRRVRGTRQPRERAHHSEPAHVHGGDLREEPRQPHREDLQPPVDPDRGVRHRGGRRDPRPAGPPALADRAPDRRAPTSPTRSSSPRTASRSETSNRRSSKSSIASWQTSPT